MSEPWFGGFFTHNNMIDRSWNEIPDGGLEATSWTCEWSKGGRDVSVSWFALTPPDPSYGWQGLGCYTDSSGVVRLIEFDPADEIARHRMWLWLQGVE